MWFSCIMSKSNVLLLKWKMSLLGQLLLNRYVEGKIWIELKSFQNVLNGYSIPTDRRSTSGTKFLVDVFTKNEAISHQNGEAIVTLHGILSFCFRNRHHSVCKSLCNEISQIVSNVVFLAPVHTLPAEKNSRFNQSSVPPPNGPRFFPGYTIKKHKISRFFWWYIE